MASTKVLPSYYVPYHMRKYGANATHQDLSKLPLKLIFEGMVAGFHAEEAKGWDTVIQYNITGEGGGKFNVVIKEQMCRLTGGEATNPKLIITASRKDWIEIAEGRLKGQNAFMQGKMKIEGDMTVLLNMDRIFSKERNHGNKRQEKK
jgi:putative sterol carrier protein